MSRAAGERARLAHAVERMRGCLVSLETALRCAGPIGADAGHAAIVTATEIATGIAKHDAYLLAELGEETPRKPERRAPVQGQIMHGLRSGGPRHIPAGTIAWWEHERAWADYAKRFGKDQSADRIAERGGFGLHELIDHLGGPPSTWRPA